VILKRQFNAESIEINFDCQDEAEMDMDDMEPEDENAATEEDDEDEGPSMEYGINFDVILTKPAGEKIVVNCVASRKLIVRSVRHLAAGKEIADSQAYAGPVFEQLNVELQDSFYAFLEERGVDDDLCFFILSYSRVKEQGEYSNWLDKILNFVEK
jgi:complement component 1 Q subcomponent-binding protein, mitochondrial